MRIAVIGSGVSGLGAAWALQRVHEVTLFEAAGRPGGHANTVTAEIDGRAVDVDTGFIVYNVANYPNLVRLFSELGVATEETDMSFGFSAAGGRLEYSGSPRGLVAQPANLLRPAYWRMLRDVARFFRTAEALLDEADAEALSLRDWLDREGYSAAFRDHHLLPMGAAIWSSTPAHMLDFPAASFVRFFRNHALLDLAGRPAWRTVSGGSRRYVERIAASLGDRLRTGCPVTRVQRHAGGIDIATERGAAGRFDAVVLATHAD
ncbi:MAG: FAD-dependent oxidoreductase, partial [Alphaproteobacteria bacterium]